MSNLLHANAKTTPRIRAEIQESKESLLVLAKRYNLNPKTIHKWRHAGQVEDKKSGPTEVISSLTKTEQQVVCEFRRITKLPLDDVYVALKDKIPTLSRSNLHRCLKRNGLNVLPKEEGSLRAKKSFKHYGIGFIHIDITEVRTRAGKCYLFVAIDRASKYVYVELYLKMTQANAVDFLRNLVAHCPFKITKILTDNGAQFTYALLAEHLRPRNKKHPFDVLCSQHNIEHRLTKFRHPWTNGQVEVFNRILKDHTTKIFFYENMHELGAHIMSYILYYNHQRKLKALNYQSPFDILVKGFEDNPQNFLINPIHMTLGLNNYHYQR